MGSTSTEVAPHSLRRLVLRLHAHVLAATDTRDDVDAVAELDIRLQAQLGHGRGAKASPCAKRLEGASRSGAGHDEVWGSRKIWSDEERLPRDNTYRTLRTLM